jgi:hypothetical protein
MGKSKTQKLNNSENIGKQPNKSNTMKPNNVKNNLAHSTEESKE